MPAEPRGPKMYVDATRTKVVPAGSPEAAFMMHEKDIKSLGIKVTKEDTKAAEALVEDDEKARESVANKARTRSEDK